MKILHTGDLHIGKSVNGFSLLEDQKYILEQIFEEAVQHKVDGVILAGDLYDRSVPSAEAVLLLDDFLTKLVKKNIKVYAVAGNHDSPERIKFANHILYNMGLVIESTLESGLKKIELDDEFGKLNIFMLPYVRFAYLSNFCEKQYDVKINSYDEGIKCIIERTDIDVLQRNILITHYFVTDNGRITNYDGEIEQIEEKELGGMDNVDASRFKMFDYTALGHIHGKMKIGYDSVRYSGSPLKYSFNEVKQKKGFYILDFKEKGDISREFCLLNSTRDMRIIEGELENLISEDVVEQCDRNDYLKVILTDEGELFNPISRLRAVYPNVMSLVYKKNELFDNDAEIKMKKIENLQPLQVFKDFYKYVVQSEVDEEKEKIISDVIKQIGDRQE